MKRKAVAVVFFILMVLVIYLVNVTKNPERNSRKTTEQNETAKAHTKATPTETTPVNKTTLPAEEESKWTPTQPRINMDHLFHGEINKRGKPVGFHSRPNGHDPLDAGLLEIKDGPNKTGVYTARVWVWEKDKTKFSSIYPDKMSWEEVIKAVLHAYKNRTTSHDMKWSGPSGFGFTIEGWLLDNGDINSAYPVYSRNE